MESVNVHGKEYHIIRLLGHGKGGYAYLAKTEDGEAVVKKIHHEPCDYYTFGNKVEAEKTAYEQLRKAGIRIPALIGIDEDAEIIVKDYIAGMTVFDLVRDGGSTDPYLDQVREMAALAKGAGLNIDFFPTNFVIRDGLIWYVDYECNDYTEKWNFENWGIRFWSRTPEFMEHLEYLKQHEKNMKSVTDPVFCDRIFQLLPSRQRETQNMKPERCTVHYFVEKLLPEEWGSIPYLPTTADLLRFLEERYPEQTALSDADRTLTYRDLVRHVGCRRSLLVKKGIQPGTNVGILGRNSIEAVEWFLALTSYGCTAVMLPAVLQPEVLAGAIPFYEIVAVIPDAEQLPKLANIQVPCIGMTEEDESFADAKAVKKTDRAAIFFTGGTTGKPKGVILSQGAIMRGSLNGTYRPGTMYEQTLIAVLPFTHVFGLIFSMLSALYAGSHVAVCGNMNLLFNEMMRVNPTTMIAVPGMAEIMLNIAKVKGPAVLGNRLKTIICGAAPVPEKLHKEFLQFGVEVLAGYGMTETANLVSGNLDMELHPTSVGCQYPEQEMRVVDGELQVKGDMLFDGYWKNPKETDAAFTEDGWLRTGDLARIDPDGFLYIVGRIKNLIILDNGENVSPEEVEAFYYRSSLIRDCLCSECVINGKAAIQLEVLASPGITDEAVTKETERIGKELPSYMQPAKIVLRHEDFEKSPSMKIVRKQGGQNASGTH